MRKLTSATLIIYVFLVSMLLVQHCSAQTAIGTLACRNKVLAQLDSNRTEDGGIGDQPVNAGADNLTPNKDLSREKLILVCRAYIKRNRVYHTACPCPLP